MAKNNKDDQGWQRSQQSARHLDIPFDDETAHQIIQRNSNWLDFSFKRLFSASAGCHIEDHSCYKHSTAHNILQRNINAHQIHATGERKHH